MLLLSHPKARTEQIKEQNTKQEGTLQPLSTKYYNQRALSESPLLNGQSIENDVLKPGLQLSKTFAVTRKQYKTFRSVVTLNILKL